MTTVTEPELLEALRQSIGTSKERPPGFYTAAELATSTGRSLRAVQREIVRLHALGQIETTRAWVTSIIGRPVPVIAYRLRKAEQRAIGVPKRARKTRV